MIRKNIFILILCFSAAVLFSSCEKKESLNGDVARPTWIAPAHSDMTSSMTAIVKVDLKVQYPEAAEDWQRLDNDLLAAFSDETCLGVGVWKEEAGAYWLYIANPTANSQELTANITLRYYSAHYKNLFEAADAFLYVNDTQKGTADTPFIPVFVVLK